MANSKLDVQELDFFKIKENLIDYLRSQNQFKDYDFEGSSLNILMDILAYNTHYMGVYGHMLSNEAFIDSATTKPSMSAKAKLMNYIPGSKKAGRAEIKLSFDVGFFGENEPDDKKIVVKRGTIVTANNNASDNRKFVVTDDIFIYNQSDVQWDYTSDEFYIYEGSYETESHIVDKTLNNQRFIIRDQNIDIDTLSVNVYQSQSDNTYETYKQASDFMEINRDSKVFFVSMNNNEYYEIFFGNDVYGKALQHGNYVEISYVSTNGATGNHANSFILDGGYTWSGTVYPGTVEVIANSYGGMDAEDIEDLRFNIPYHYRRQNRCVTADDYKNILLSEYRNINSVNVWGGEDHQPPAFGRVYICIKPKYGEVLSSASKSYIINDILRKYNTATIEPIILDPDFLYLDIDVYVRYNPLDTNKLVGQVKSDISTTIDNYNTNVLNRFDTYYSDSEFNAQIKESNTSILTSYTKIQLEKRFTPAFNTEQNYYVDFVNPVVPATFHSGYFEFRARKSYFEDDGKGNLIINYLDGYTNKWETYKDETFGEIDYDNGLVRLTNFYITNLYNKDKLFVHVSPLNPDFFTKRNNVVIIDDYVVHVNEDFETESTKV